MCLSQLASDRNDVDGELNHRTQAAVSWTEADAKAMSADDTQTVVSTVAQVLSSVSMNNIDVLRSSATVQRLVAAHKHAAALQDLTKVLSSGTLVDFDAAASKHAAALKELGVDAARVRSRLRLLSLAALPTGVPLAFTEVAKRLDGPVDGVETSVVEAVRLGIIDARIDQLQSTVVVMRSIPRVFEKKEWESLLAMLGNCEQDLQTQMRALKTAVEHHEQHVQAQLASAAAARS